MSKFINLALLTWFGVHWAYVLVMASKAKVDELTFYWKVMLIPAALLGAVLDFVFQFTFGWLMFLETPFRGGVFFSGRVQHHYRYGTGWRRRLAQFWARNLNVFDLHIKE